MRTQDVMFANAIAAIAEQVAVNSKAFARMPWQAKLQPRMQELMDALENGAASDDVAGALLDERTE